MGGKESRKSWERSGSNENLRGNVWTLERLMTKRIQPKAGRKEKERMNSESISKVTWDDFIGRGLTDANWDQITLVIGALRHW